jgi:septal ring-binding cell division protein DamX
MTIGGYMRLLRLVLLSGLVAACLSGCSDKQKEADRLEREMMAMDSSSESLLTSAASEDSAASDTAVSGVDVQTTTPVADASAIPAEDIPAIVPMPQPPAGYAFTIQVAACEDTVYARYLVKLFKTRGYSPFMTVVNVSGQTYYRVRVGGYATVAEAREVQTELVDKFSLQSWIDRLGK